MWSGAPEGLTRDDVAAAVESARGQWVNSSCSAFDMTFVEGEPSSDSTDGQNSLVFDDPEGEVQSTYPAITKFVSTGRNVSWNGVSYLEYGDADIVFNDDRSWVTDEAIEAGECSDEMSFQAVLTRYLGYLAGVGTSCGEDDECADPALADATMFWEVKPCDTSTSTVEMDDAWSLATIYGTPIRVACTRDEADDTSVSCSLTEPSGAPVTWDFGDGATSSDASASHAYADGTEQFVSACVTVAECGREYCFDLRVPGGESDSAPTDSDSGGDDAGGCGCASGKADEGAMLLALAAGTLVLGRRRG